MLKPILLLLSVLMIAIPADAQPIEGNWVDARYVQNLESTRSPYLAFLKLGEISEFVLRESFGDSVLIIFGGHDAAFFPITKRGERLAIEGIGQATFEDDQLIFTAADTKVYRFSKIPSDLSRMTAVPRLLRDRLFSGKFELPYATMQGRSLQRISLQTTAIINGIPGIEQMEILTDFDDIADFDIARVTIAGEEKWMGWSLQDGLLILYKLEKGRDYVYARGSEWNRYIHKPTQ